MNEYRFIGPPGTGKTTAITKQLAVEAEAWGGENVVALSHTRAAAHEIAGRDQCLPDENIGTLHAMAYRAIGRPEIAEEPKHLREFSQEHPEWPMGAGDDDDLWARSSYSGSAALQEYGRLRNLAAPRESWPTHVVNFARDWEHWKAANDLVDYTDMIEMALLRFPTMPGSPHTIICDEMQDLSRLQYELLRSWGESAERVITAGDQDQCIYTFTGADPGIFTENVPIEERVLEQSHRIPAAVHAAAVPWVQQITERKQVQYRLRAFPGYVDPSPACWQASGAIIDSIQQHLQNGHTTMVMASCSFMLRPVLKALRKAAIPYGNPWQPEDAHGWNPLGCRHARPKLLEGLLAFASPAVDPASGVPMPGLWTVADLRSWASLLKGVFERGAKKRIEELPDDTSPLQVYELLKEITTEAALRILRRDEPAFDWFRGRLKAQYSGQQLCDYVFSLLSAHGLSVLTAPPRVFVGTIHSFKGAEADHVVVFPDLSRAGMSAYLGAGRDTVIRQFYVAMTRARLGLTLCAPSAKWTVTW
ncbi:MAG: AAA family ATPase [Armatimonadia bacterium]|nr:AAA family ATPase [Armatimonadia bacterium]